MGDMWDIAAKQMRDSFSKKRFMLVVGLFFVLTLGSVYLGIDAYQTDMDNYLDPGTIHADEPSFMQIYEPLVGFSMAMVAGILGLIISYNSISRERRDGTIEILLSYPIYRDEIINGKIVANIFIVAFSLLLAFLATSGLAMYLLDAVPTMEEVSRIAFLWIGTTIYITFFIGLGTLLSTVFRSQWRSLATGSLLLLLFIGMPFIAGIAANYIYEMPEPEYQPQPMHREVTEETEVGEVQLENPEPDNNDQEDTEQRREEIRAKRERFVRTSERLSPATTYNQYTGNMLGTRFESGENVRPTFEESLSASIDALIYLLSHVAMVFTAAYAVFLRQDL